MTSPAIMFLYIVLVSTICGTALDYRADDDVIKDHKNSTINVNVNNRWTNKLMRNYFSYDRHLVKDENSNNDIQVSNFYMRRMNKMPWQSGQRTLHPKNRLKRYVNDPCEYFTFKERENFITHPHVSDNNMYYATNTSCVTVISTHQENTVIKLTFVDIFDIEYHPRCNYDYLEVRDGLYGYAKLIDKVCGQNFPGQMTTTGPYAWLKFRSDETIEYKGFKINIDFITGNSHKIPESCYMKFPKGITYGTISAKEIDPVCNSSSVNQALDVLWTIETPKNTNIYLNFTYYKLAEINNCEANVIQVFGAILELGSKLAQYCGSIAKSVVTTDKNNGNIVQIRYFASRTAKNATFNATFNAFRTLISDNSADDKCDPSKEFDCEDGSCINKTLQCDGIAHCRLKTDELCVSPVTKMPNDELQQLTVIVIIFSLILFGMCFVFMFKCIRKLYQDQKMIKENLRQSCEDRLDNIAGSRLALEPMRLQIDSGSRVSLETENLTNEILKKQTSSSKHMLSSLESDHVEENHVEPDSKAKRREINGIMQEAEEIKKERNNRTKQRDLARKEESLRSRTTETDDRGERKVSTRELAPGMKESECQTRDSLFDTVPTTSTDRSTTNSRGVSSIAYSGGTIARPSPPGATMTAEVTMQIFTATPPKTIKPQKKSDQRPLSSETTRSAPDVIIVGKPTP